jgi:putative DNA primase/helicase
MESNAKITHYANVVDDASGEASEVYGFTQVGGRRRKIIIERENADDPKLVRARCRKYNAALTSDIAKSEAEVRSAIKAEPQNRFRYAARNGWLKDNTAFVTTDRVIDSVQRNRKILPPRRHSDAQRLVLKPEGTLSTWQAEVARICGYSDLGMFALSAAFAAMILKMSGRHSFGLNIHGRSKVGKSTILIAASSVAGVGREGELSNWAATAAAVGEHCREHSDRLMPLNEVGLISKNNAYARIQLTIYKIAENREGDRHSKSVFSTNDGSAGYLTIFFSTAEHSINEYAQLAGAMRDEGELARCTDVPATRPSAKTVIDRFPPSIDPDQHLRWARKALKGLRKACEKNHGVALEPFVKFLMKDPLRAEKRVAFYMKEFMKGIETTGMSGAMEHAAENFSLIYAGGCMAVEAGILKYTKDAVFDAIEGCFLDARKTAIESRDPLNLAKRTLKQNLTSDRISRQSKGMTKEDQARFDGFVRHKDARTEYIIRAAALRKWYETMPRLHTSIIKWLEQKHFLLPRKTRGEGNSTDWAEKNVTWPDGTPTRSIVFLDPFA